MEDVKSNLDSFRENMSNHYNRMTSAHKETMDKHYAFMIDDEKEQDEKSEGKNDEVQISTSSRKKKSPNKNF